MDSALTNQMILSVFRKKNLRITPQRMDVYRFLKENPVHPSADMIYHAMVKEHPNLSRTTIYNILNTLVENGLAITVKVDEKEVRYDGNASYHGHFRCLSCGEITDFVPAKVKHQGLEKYNIVQQDVYFSGFCPHCNNILK